MLSGSVFSNLEARARSSGNPLFPLHIGDTWVRPMATAYQWPEAPDLFQYAPPCGDPVFLETVIRRTGSRAGVALTAETVCAVSGATAGVRDAVQTLVAPGDEVILPSPFWPLVRGTVVARGAVPVEVPFYTRLDDAGFDPERALEEAVTDRTTLIYLNTPHNPTGRVLTEAQIACVAAVANRHNLWVLSDEVYEEICFAGSPPTWAREDLVSRTVAIHSMSKAFAMAGARVGWAHGPAEVMRVFRAVHTYQDYGPSKAFQLIAAEILRDGVGDDWMRRTRETFSEAGALMSRALGVPDVQGGTFGFIRAGQRCDELLVRCADNGVLLTPGGVCGADYADWYRLCFTVLPPESLEKALAIILECRGAVS